jgi:TetR/AcrR family transcriptional repressor of nem operon
MRRTPNSAAMATTVPGRGEATRQKLLEVASRHFAARGYEGTSFNDLIAESGLSKGACYHHFRSKEELALETYRATQKRLFTLLSSATEGIDSPLQQLFTWLRVRARAFVEDSTLQCLPRLSAHLAQEPAGARQVRAMHANVVETIAAHIRRAQQAGELRQELDPSLLARIMFATMVGIGEVSDRESGGTDHLQRTDELIALLAAAMVPRPPAAPRGTGKPSHEPARTRSLPPRTGRRRPSR